MIIITREYLRQPNRSQYLMALLGLSTDGQRLHWRLCSRVINTYRRNAKDGFQVKEPQGTEKEERQQKTKRVYSFRSKKRVTVNQVQGSRKNTKIFNALKPIVRFTSRGKNRPSRRKKIQFKSYPMNHHLRGSKYGEGQYL